MIENVQCTGAPQESEAYRTPAEVLGAQQAPLLEVEAGRDGEIGRRY